MNKRHAVARFDRRRLLMGGAALLGAGLGVHGTVGARAQNGTPEAGEPAAGDGMVALLGITPQFPPLAAEARAFLTYADLAAQYAAVGMTAPELTPDSRPGEWSRPLTGLALEDIANTGFDIGKARDGLGWDIGEVDQFVGVGSFDERAVLLRGRFDPADLRAAWEAGHYLPLDLAGPDGAEAFGRDPELHFGLDDPVVGLVGHAFDRVALLPSGELVYARTEDALERVLATAAGQADAMIDQAGVSELRAAAGESLASALVLPGLALTGMMPLPGFDPFVGTPAPFDQVKNDFATAEAERQQMPPVSLALIGTTAGGPLPVSAIVEDATPVPADVSGIPDAEFRFLLSFDDEAAATAAAAVIEDRLETGQSARFQIPWSDVFDGWDVAVAPEDPTIALARIMPRGARLNDWYTLYISRDLGFLAW